MTDIGNAASPEAGAETAAPAADVTPAAAPGDSALDADSALEAIYDKITASDGDDDTPAAPDKAAAADKPDQPQKADGAPDFTPASGPPNSWSAEMKGKWDAIPPDARAYIAQRETEAHDQISRMGQEVARYRPIGELIDSRQDIFDQHGIEPSDGLAALLDAQALLDKDPMEGIAAIADKYGIDLAATFGGAGDGTQQRQVGTAVDPQTRQQLQRLEHQNRILQQQQTLRENAEKTKEQRDAAARREEAKTTVDKWGEGKTHFAREDVKKLMGQFLGAGTSADLDDAYDQACHAIPDVRKLVTADASKAAIAEQARAAADAKRSRAVNSGTGAGKPAKSGSWDDDAALEATYSRIAG